MCSDYNERSKTRALQDATHIVRANYLKMKAWGPGMLLKVRAPMPPVSTVSGYVTVLPAILGRTPLEMEDMLGLRKGQLAFGADVYQLERIPKPDEFRPRGYTTLVDGLRLREGLTQSSDGYRPGYGAWQIELISEIPVRHITHLRPDERFEPGIHPLIAHLYPKR